MMNTHCPLCKSTKHTVRSNIASVDLINVYKSQFNINIKKYFYNIDIIKLVKCNTCNLQYYDPTISGDEYFYNHFQKFDWYYMDDKNEYHLSKKYIQNDHKLLEIGSGKGAFSHYIKNSNYTGLDFSLNAKEMAKKEGIEVKNQTISEHAKLHSGTYDVVCAFQVLEHIPSVNKFISDCINCLKPGGTLIFAVPSEDSFLRYTINGILNMPPHHLTRWTDNSLIKLGEIFNLDLVEIIHEKVQSHHFYGLKLTEILFSRYGDNKLIIPGLLFKIKQKIYEMVIKFIYPKKSSRELLPNGHTVIAIYKKI
ncbi:MAG: class I SAM-dependent methyltransferase [Desulfobulbaceae bacterium]|nr:class I SAM-dependent methyltransferase [Desulfobulbaceae bacterium]